MRQLIPRPDLLAAITDAIDRRKEIRLLYGKEMTLRRVLPHAVGASTPGNPLLLAWQKGGASLTGTGGWKHFNLAKIAAVEVSDTTFVGPVPGYNSDDQGLAVVWKAI